MAKSPEEMKAAMIAGLPEKTGKSLEEWLRILQPTGLTKHLYLGSSIIPSGTSKKLTFPLKRTGRICRGSASTQHQGPVAKGSPSTSATGTQSTSSTRPTSAP